MIVASCFLSSLERDSSSAPRACGGDDVFPPSRAAASRGGGQGGAHPPLYAGTYLRTRGRTSHIDAHAQIQGRVELILLDRRLIKF